MISDSLIFPLYLMLFLITESWNQQSQNLFKFHVFYNVHGCRTGIGQRVGQVHRGTSASGHENTFDIRVVVTIVRVLGFDETIGSQVQA